ncbi:MAG: AAA family ATPase, partial [Pseudomonadota bacterium]
ESFSTRRAQIEERLKELGTTAEDASHRTRAGVALTTRAPKEAVDRDVAIAAWRGALSADERVSLDGAKSAAEERTTEARQESVEAGRSGAAQTALTDAVAHLSERNAAFTVEDLRAKANAFGLGRADRHDVDRALGRARDTGQTIDRDVVLPDRMIGADMRQDGLTTQEARAHEAAILGREQAGRGAVKPLATERQADKMIARFERESARQGFSWTEGQRDSLKVLLTARDQVTGIQGLAGTAKTTTVLANYAAMSAKRGLTITALAPTHAAANELGHALGVTGKTVDQHLTDLSSGKSKAPEASAEEAKTTTKGKIWVVDEAGMASVTQMRGILDKAAENDARVVLVGDVKQLGAVGPGAAFLQLQKAGMLTGRLEEIVRQKDTELLRAVEISSGASPAATIAYFKERPLQTIEAKDVETRRTAIADKWLALGPAGREKTLVIEPSREGRDEVTKAIRAGLVREGTLDGNEVKTSRLERRDMSGPERKRAEYYRPGDKLTFSRAYTFDGARVPAGELLTITDRDASKGGVGLRRADGTSFKWHPTAKGSDRVQVFQVKSDDLRGGDRIQWTDNSKALGLHNGRKGEVLSVDPERQTVEVKFGKETRTLDLKDPAHKHWRHAYVQTVYQAQGKTSERVIFHAPS